jgi:AcrR family transcriptional regulator
MESSEVSRRSVGAKQNPEAATAILDAAESLLAKLGLKGLTTDAIAREARASKTTLYRWWPNRGALLLALYMRMKTGHMHADSGSLLQDIAFFYRQIFAFWRGDGHVFSLIIAEAQQDATVSEALLIFKEERIAELLLVVVKAERRGELRRNANPRVIAESILAHAWLYLLTRELDADPMRLADQLITPWLNGPPLGLATV